MKVAWETKDYEVLSSMFPEKLTYFESPFLRPYETRQQVIEEWKRGLDKQSNIVFGYNVLHEGESECFTHWEATFIRENATVMLDGVFHFRLDSDNRCAYFKMWWVTK